jgi:hypothetical protein
VCVCVCVCMYINIYTYIHSLSLSLSLTHTHTHTNTNTHMYIHRERERERQRHIVYIVYICISTHPCTLCVRSSHPLCSCAREQREHEKEFNTTVASFAGASSAYEDAHLQVLALYTASSHLFPVVPKLMVRVCSQRLGHSGAIGTSRARAPSTARGACRASPCAASAFIARANSSCRRPLVRFGVQGEGPPTDHTSLWLLYAFLLLPSVARDRVFHPKVLTRNLPVSTLFFITQSLGIRSIACGDEKQSSTR